MGFTLSPVLWRKLPGSRSAGRVQSVSLRLVVDREIEIEKFRSQEYWTVEASVAAGADPFVARLTKHDGKRLTKFDLGDEAAAFAARDAVKAATVTVHAVEKKPGRRSPAPPFTTSTLQQEASASSASAQRTMGRPERLYEGRHRRRDRRPDHPCGPTACRPRSRLDEARQVIGGIYGRE